MVIGVRSAKAAEYHSGVSTRRSISGSFFSSQPCICIARKHRGSVTLFLPNLAVAPVVGSPWVRHDALSINHCFSRYFYQYRSWSQWALWLCGRYTTLLHNGVLSPGELMVTHLECVHGYRSTSHYDPVRVSILFDINNGFFKIFYHFLFFIATAGPVRVGATNRG